MIKQHIYNMIECLVWDLSETIAFPAYLSSSAKSALIQLMKKKHYTKY